MKAQSPRQPARVLLLIGLTALLCVYPIAADPALAVTRTEVQMGDPDIGDLAPKKAAAVRIRDKTFSDVERLRLVLEIFRSLYFRTLWF